MRSDDYTPLLPSETVVECGSCGMYHREDYWGDCRNDDERFDDFEVEVSGAQIAEAEEEDE